MSEFSRMHTLLLSCMLLLISFYLPAVFHSMVLYTDCADFKGTWPFFYSLYTITSIFIVLDSLQSKASRKCGWSRSKLNLPLSQVWLASMIRGLICLEKGKADSTHVFIVHFLCFKIAISCAIFVIWSTSKYITIFFTSVGLAQAHLNETIPQWDN